jgi:Holliday junction resolvasome RuvABC endonuclease subunit
MKILGIDPGITSGNPLGMAFISDDPVSLLWSGAYAGDDKQEWDQRLRGVALWIDDCLGGLVPDGVVYELPHMQKNSQVLSKLAHACGIIVGLCAVRNIPYVGVQPLQAKRAWTGNPQASKAEMMAQAKLVFQQDLPKDVADACGIAWYGMSHYQNQRLLDEYTKTN